YVLEDGWWLPVSPGTMRPTLGGCLSANVHGKNNWEAGPLGEHVLEFTALMPTGKEITCTPKKNKDLFYSVISSMGILGVFTSITFQMKKVYSGNLDVYAWAEPTLKSVLQATDEHKEKDYVVGWVDCSVPGKNLGRGQLHTARYLDPGEDSHPNRTLHIEYQDLPDTIMGLVPRSIVWQLLRFGMNNLGTRFGNMGKYFASRTLGHKKHYLQSFAEFTYLLDYVPNWERAYGKNGLIQYQSFIPKETAHDAFKDIIQLSQRYRLPSFLGVVKRHRPDNFLLSHAVDGFSLAMDFKVRQLKKLRQMTNQMNQIVLEAGGRFYFAKDSTLTADVVSAYLGEATIKKFKKLKAKYDPNGILQTDLYQRCFGE
ncbi:MAG: FAD-binding protein, partial [Chloroflexota bacterium]